MLKTLLLVGLLLTGAGLTVRAYAANRSATGTMKTERGFVIHDRESAPEATHEVLDWYQNQFQFSPHLAAVMADSPALSRSYWQLQLNLQKHGTLSPPEDNIVQMAIAVENECQYCTAGHTMAGKMFFEASDEELAALRMESKLPKAKFDALRNFALHVAESKGRVSDSELQAFLGAGYTRQQSLDVVANVAAKVMSNYTNQLARTPLDPQLEALAEGLPFREKREIHSEN
ncbi:MAG: carboxymuconolactone decarboxylase family protein [Planctomycetota bacterium]